MQIITAVLHKIHSSMVVDIIMVAVIHLALNRLMAEFSKFHPEAKVVNLVET